MNEDYHLIRDEETQAEEGLYNETGDYNIDWSPQNQEEDAIQDGETEEVPLGEQARDSQEVDGQLRVDPSGEDEPEEEEGEEVQEPDEEDYSVELGQISQRDEADEQEDQEEEVEEDDDDPEMDESWDKLFQFMEENPGATPEDYVNITQGFDDLTDEEALKVKIASDNGLDPETDKEEIDFLYADKYAYDEELDSEREIKLRQIASKKDLREVRSELDELKEQYASDLVSSANAPEVQEAVEFYKDFKTQQEDVEDLQAAFIEDTEDIFTEKFKGFDFKYGDGQSQRIKVNPKQIVEEQSDIANFISKFTDDEGYVKNVQGYHKALWAAQNADALFSHAYEQGRADAVRNSAKTAKNINMEARQDGAATEAPHNNSGFKLVDEDRYDQGFKFNFD